MIVNFSWFVACAAIICSMVAPALRYDYGVFGDQGLNIAYALSLAALLCFRLVRSA